MSYHLGIDLGTTCTAAAVARDGRAEIASVGTRTPTIPSVVLLREDETLDQAVSDCADDPCPTAR